MGYLKFRTFFTLLKETFKEWQRHKASQLAAALAYYTVFSLAPLLVIIIAIAGSIFGEAAAREEILTQIQVFIGDSGTEVINTILNNASQPRLQGLASLISIAVLLLGASGIFAQLQDALNQIWDVAEQSQGGIPELIKKRLLSFLMVFVIGFFLLASLIITTVLGAINNFGNDLLPGFEQIWDSLNFLSSFILITLLFALLYKYLPDVSISWKDVRLGAILTALLFIFGKEVLGIYLSSGSFSSPYGAAGSLIIVLAWIYYSAQILLFGAEFTQVYAKRYGSKKNSELRATINQR